LPRTIGELEEKEMVVGIGKFGPYIRHNNKFYSLKKGIDDPYEITTERAIEIIREKTETDKQRIINDYGDIQVLNGRYGPYITKEKKNFRIPKGSDAAKLTKEECIAIVENSDKPK
jgi:DNA topoisomerase-1